MIDLMTAPYAALLLRWSLGIMFVAHALLKWRVYTMPGTVATFRSIGLPGWLAYVVTAAELIGGGCLVVGLAPRYVSLAACPADCGNDHNGSRQKWLAIRQQGRRLGVPAFWAAKLVVQFLVGDGALTLLPSPSFL
jgi:putative oxidoreductase